MTQTTDGGCQVDIPANASELWLYPEYQYVGAAVIDGKTYQFTENETFFSGDGWQMQSLYGGVQLRLNGYHGGTIDLPYTDLVTVTGSLYGDNSITGGTDAQGEVTVRLREGEYSATGRGSDPDIIVASAKAYIDALNRLDHKERDALRTQEATGEPAINTCN